MFTIKRQSSHQLATFLWELERKKIIGSERIRVSLERVDCRRTLSSCDHSARAIPSANGATARRQICADSESLVASEAINKEPFESLALVGLTACKTTASKC